MEQVSEKSLPKPAVGKSKKKATGLPTYTEMVIIALRALKERNGSSRQKIAKYISSHYPAAGELKKIDGRVQIVIRKLLGTGVLTNTRGLGASGSVKIVSSPAESKKKISKPKSDKKTKKPSAVKTAVKAPKKALEKKKAAPKPSAAVVKKVASPKPKAKTPVKKAPAKVAPKAAVKSKPAAAKPSAKKAPAAKPKKTAAKPKVVKKA